MIDRDRTLDMLTRWADASEALWRPIPGRPDLGCYGTGYDGWGVQTNQKYLSAMALLASEGDGRAAERALAALRYSLATHVSGDTPRTDGSRWGHTWISSLGVERMMFGVYLLEPLMTDADRAAVDRVLAGEADWLLKYYDVQAFVWAAHGPNKPESNLWNGCVMWRAAEHMSDHPHADAWREKARCFLVNAVSVAADIGVEPRNVGKANFFPNFALDHHSYMNVGYMVICVSNAAMLHFDLKGKGFGRPAELDHHQGDLWSVLRRMLFADGRLARIGGDSRVRYAYCQDYLFPSLCYAAEVHREPHAAELAGALLDTVCREFDHNGDGTFYGPRLQHIAADNPAYYPRLESDRAGVLAMTLRFAELMDRQPAPPEASFESSVAGRWCESEYGAVMHRCDTRLASFVWPALSIGQNLSMALCTPPDDGDLAEWTRNLTGRVDLCHSPYHHDQPQHKPAGVVRHWIGEFDGGFATAGEIIEGRSVELAEGWRGENLARHRLALIALPDGHTMVGLQRCVAGGKRIYLQEVQGMHLNIPNDLFNEFRRTLYAESGESVLQTPAATDELIDLRSRWINVDNRIGAVGLYGAESMSVRRTAGRCAGKYKSLHLEQFAFAAAMGPFAVEAGDEIFDVGWMVVSSADATTTADLAGRNAEARLDDLPDGLRGVTVRGCDGADYIVIANFSDVAQRVDIPNGFGSLLPSPDQTLPSGAVAVLAAGA